MPKGLFLSLSSNASSLSTPSASTASPSPPLIYTPLRLDEEASNFLKTNPLFRRGRKFWALLIYEEFCFCSTVFLNVGRHLCYKTIGNQKIEMESALTWENKALINELTQGLEKAKQLRIHLCSTCPCEAQDLLLRRIISTFEKALMILKWGGSVGQAQECAALPAAGSVLKSQPIWTEQVRVNSENALEGPGDDGYSWRKYGQKTSWELNIPANLRVNTEDLDIKEMPTYFSFPSTFACRDRENRCSPVSALADDNQLSTYSPVFYSPAKTESNYSSAAVNYQMRNYGEAPIQQSETDTADIISAHASTTNSPTGGMEFSIDPVYLDPNFPFNIPGFFT
ncbi:UNVERIFIED_CONTAM: putative WRKY transcription factor 53 [Sesamum latifolium]|uniref:WRKY transcription factor 53 n=1 Tax=Sesamum latifolium TaxID=2727402 RepID=A0AAW2SMK7_9LAMI